MTTGIFTPVFDVHRQVRRITPMHRPHRRRTPCARSARRRTVHHILIAGRLHQN